MTPAQERCAVGRSVEALVPTYIREDSWSFSRSLRSIFTLFLVLSCIFLITSAASLALAQTATPVVTGQWKQSYAAGYSAHSILPMGDGYIIAGNGSTKTTGAKGSDMWLAKTDLSGALQWSKTYGGTSSGAANASAYSVRNSYSKSGGFILAGWVANSSGSPMPYIVKTSASGEQQWGKYYEDLAPGGAADVQETLDGGYIVVGAKFSGTTTTAFVMTTDSSGYEQSKHMLAAGSAPNKLEGAYPAAGSGYVLVGFIGSYGSRQGYLVKLDENGSVQWSQKYGASDSIGNDVVPDHDGYLFCGATNAQGKGGYDAWLVKTDPQGSQKWQRTFGGTEDDSALSIQETKDGGYVLGGLTQSYTPYGVDKPWLVKTDHSGYFAWDVYWYTIEGAAESVMQASDGSYVFAGSDAVKGAPYLLQTTAEMTSGPTQGGQGVNLTTIGILIVLVGVAGVVGIGYMRRAKRAASQIPPSASSGGITETAGGAVTSAAGGAVTSAAGGAVTSAAGGAVTGAGGAYRAQTPSESLRSEQDWAVSAPSFPVELGSQYSEVRYLGEGGFARVFSALNLQREPVAVKVLKTNDPKAGKLFATEAANWTVLRHENIVKLMNYNIFPVPYLESELCDGNVELEMLRGPVTLERSIEIVKEVARGLSYAHHLKILHGDIKPSNMLLKENVVKVSDWGLSKLKTEQSVSIAGVTLQYAAPEELSRQFGRADERTDIYQLGVLFYQLVTGKLPFADDPAIIDAILQDTPVPPSQIRPISPQLDSIILKCLRKRKEERYQSMDQLLTDLGGVSN